MVPLTDNVDYEAFGNVPSQWSNAGYDEYYGRGHMSMYAPRDLRDVPAKLRKQGRTNTIKRTNTRPHHLGLHI
ncbi:unnamed protein product [Protopolystoma xenopodis]|uniref:Uncharacterized protein n=1 Tax=Protopolystoma xenopodis TaxID=117903 RepID=A0A3S5FG66_9PLAT|nr:unnamed protein product [Protopolystoma xenopodis]